MGENCSCNGRHLNLRSTSRRVLACASVAAGLMAVLATASAAVPAHADASSGSEADRADAAALEVVLPDPFDQTATCELPRPRPKKPRQQRVAMPSKKTVTLPRRGTRRPRHRQTRNF